MAALAGAVPPVEGPCLLALIKSVPGNVSLESMLTEIRKLTAIRAVGLPPGLFADVAPNVMLGWRARAAVESPSTCGGGCRTRRSRRSPCWPRCWPGGNGRSPTAWSTC